MKLHIALFLFFLSAFFLGRVAMGQGQAPCSLFQFEVIKTEGPLLGELGVVYLNGPFKLRSPYTQIRYHIGTVVPGAGQIVNLGTSTALYDNNRHGFSVGNLPTGNHRLIIENIGSAPCRDTVEFSIGPPTSYFNLFVVSKLNPTTASSQDGKLVLEVRNPWKGRNRFLPIEYRKMVPYVSISKNGGPFIFPPPLTPGSRTNVSWLSSSSQMSNASCSQNGDSLNILLCNLGVGNYRIVVKSKFDSTVTDTITYNLTENPCSDFQFSISSVSPDARPKTFAEGILDLGFGRLVLESGFVPNSSFGYIFHEIYKSTGGGQVNLAVNFMYRPLGVDVYNPSVNPNRIWTNTTNLIYPNEPGNYYVILSSESGMQGCKDTLQFSVPEYPCNFQIDSIGTDSSTSDTAPNGSAYLKAKESFSIESVLRNGAPLSPVYAIDFCADLGGFVCPPLDNVNIPTPFCGIPIKNYQKICYIPNGEYKVVVSYNFDRSCFDTIQFRVGPTPVADTIGRPMVSLPSGVYNGNQTVTLSSAVAGTEIYYTTNGNLPRLDVANGFTRLYTGPFVVSQSTTLRSVARRGALLSEVSTRTYTINNPQVVANPAFSLNPGAYSGIQSLSLSTGTSGATLYYTTNGNVPRIDVPNSFTLVYTGPITLDRTMTIRAIAIRSGYINSGVTVGNFIINDVGTVTAPVFSPGPGVFGNPQTVSISTTTPGAQILFTTNGMTPRQGLFAARLYSTPINLALTTVLKARAFLSGSIPSAVSVGNYTIGAIRKAVDGDEETPFYFENETGTDWNEEVRIFPNPSASGRFEVLTGRDEIKRTRVFTITGKEVEVRVGHLSDQHFEIQLEKAPPGLYFLQLETDQGKWQFPILK